MAQNRTFEENLAFGKTGEVFVSELLKADGWHVIPSYDYTGDDNNKAPKLHGKSSNFILPDLDTCLNGLRLWVEVKKKSKADTSRGMPEHGINLRHFNDYLTIQSMTGSKVFLFILEENTGELLFHNIDFLNRKGRKLTNAHGMGRGGMIFWERVFFHNWFTNKQRKIEASLLEEANQ